MGRPQWCRSREGPRSQPPPGDENRNSPKGVVRPHTPFSLGRRPWDDQRSCHLVPDQLIDKVAQASLFWKSDAARRTAPHQLLPPTTKTDQPMIKNFLPIRAATQNCRMTALPLSSDRYARSQRQSAYSRYEPALPEYFVSQISSGVGES